EKDLATWEAADFNARNIPRLLPTTRPPNRPARFYYAIAADADKNHNTYIDNSPDEWSEQRQENNGLYYMGDARGREVMDIMYQTLRGTAGVNVRARTGTTAGGRL